MGAELSWPTSPETLTLELITEPQLTEPPELGVLHVEVSRWLSRLAPLLERQVLSEMRERCREQLDRALRLWSNALRTWAAHTVGRLGERFAAQAEPMRTHVRRVQARTTRPADAEGITADLDAIETRTAR